LNHLLLRHALAWRRGSNWTLNHRRWLAGLVFDDCALAATFVPNGSQKKTRNCSVLGWVLAR
jgi:hypothetical protein